MSANGWPGSRIEIVSQERRREILGMPPTRSVHGQLYPRMPFASAVEVNAPAAGTQAAAAPSGVTARVMAWNAARCVDVGAFARVIHRSAAGIVLLTEMDWGLARSGQVHTARELASRLSMGYAYAVEFLELGLGDERERAAHHGAVNEAGYHGAAILCAGPLSRARRVRLEDSGGWFEGARGQRRVGGRVALCATTVVGGTEIVVCSIHLESESDPAERLREMEVLFDELDDAYTGCPVVIGGDLNTFSISKKELDDPSSVQRNETESPGRFADPVRHEPLFVLARERGYGWGDSNVPGAPTHHQQESRSRPAAMKLDWFLTRGVTARDPGILPAADPGSGAVLSDHDAVVVTIGTIGAKA
jgi:endonuclease/exonuclease/phosphatase family metal-dependent hydrolase